VIDVSVDLVVTDATEDAVALEHLADWGLQPGEPQGYAGLLGEVEDLAHLGRPLGVDEVHSPAIEHDRGAAGRRQRDFPDPVLQGVGSGEEQAAVQAQDRDPGELLVPGVLYVAWRVFRRLSDHPLGNGSAARS